MTVSAIVLAAGKGLRLGLSVSKPLSIIDSKPLIIYSLKAFNCSDSIDEVVIAANPSNIRGIADQVKRYKIDKVKVIVLGGERRQDSVYNGLSAINPFADLVLIHDAARPLVAKDKISALVRHAAKDGAAILAVPVKATIKKVKSPPLIPPFSKEGLKGDLKIKDKSRLLIVDKTLDRDELWEAQTPQAFKKDLLLEAYKRFRDSDVTDDASLVEKLGARVNVVLGSYNNIKITTPEDLVLAEAIIKKYRKR